MLEGAVTLFRASLKRQRKGKMTGPPGPNLLVWDLCKCCVKSILSPSLSVLSICGEAPLLASKRSRVADRQCTCKHVHLGLDSPCCTEYTGQGHGQTQSKLWVKSATDKQVSPQCGEETQHSSVFWSSIQFNLICIEPFTLDVVTKQLHRDMFYTCPFLKENGSFTVHLYAVGCFLISLKILAVASCCCLIIQ